MVDSKKSTFRFRLRLRLRLRQFGKNKAPCGCGLVTITYKTKSFIGIWKCTFTPHTKKSIQIYNYKPHRSM